MTSSVKSRSMHCGMYPVPISIIGFWFCLLIWTSYWKDDNDLRLFVCPTYWYLEKLQFHLVVLYFPLLKRVGYDRCCIRLLVSGILTYIVIAFGHCIWQKRLSTGKYYFLGMFLQRQVCASTVGSQHAWLICFFWETTLIQLFNPRCSSNGKLLVTSSQAHVLPRI